jgi:alpha-L-rhamnosidase
LSAPAYSASTATVLQPQQLRCEYLREPLGIGERNPRLSWILASSRRAETQTAYEIIVASNEARANAGDGDLWATGRVKSEATNVIRYAGQPLVSGQRVWWRVRVWDRDGGPSTWSLVSCWEMALLGPDLPLPAGGPDTTSWHGHWIARVPFAGGAAAAREPLPLFRRLFALNGKVRRGRAYIAGLGYFELTLNGHRIGDQQLNPAFTRYDKRVLYVTHDVTAALYSGENVIGVALGNGWFNVGTTAAWDFDQAPWRATPRLIAEVRIELDDGRTVTVASDETWKTNAGPITFSDIYGGENFDARLEEPGWDRPGFDERSWQPARIVDAPKGRLVAQAMHPVRVTRIIAPVAMSQPAPGVFLFDAGQNLTGNVELAISGPAGSRVTMRYGEKLDARGRLDQSDIGRHIFRFGPKQQFQTDIYTLKGEGMEHWKARFTYHGFQYIEVTDAPAGLTLDNIRIHVLHSDVPEAGMFESSDATLNRIWANGRSSYLGNLVGIPTDCPHREKNGWTAAAHIACEQGLYYQDGITVYEKWLDDLGDEQFITGALPGIVPTSGQWGYAFGSGPAWDSAFLIIPWHLYEYYGDITALQRHYDGARKYIDYLTTRARDNIVAIGLGDWSIWKAQTPPGITDTAYYYRGARIVAAAARILGRDNDAKEYDELAERIRAAFNRAFYDAETGSYVPGTQTAIGCALYFGLVEPENEALVVGNLVAAIEANGRHLDFGFLGSKYVLNALAAHGHAELAYAMIMQDSPPSYAWQIAQGATTLWEEWNGSKSQNHTFFGDVNAWMMKTIAGINCEPAEPGFRHIVIKPRAVGDLSFASAHYDSIRGRVASSWTLKDGEFRLDVTIPANCTATIHVPAMAPSAIRESGCALADAVGVELRTFESGRAVIAVGSGDYSFVSSAP